MEAHHDLIHVLNELLVHFHIPLLLLLHQLEPLALDFSQRLLVLLGQLFALALHFALLFLLAPFLSVRVLLVLELLDLKDLENDFPDILIRLLDADDFGDLER